MIERISSFEREILRWIAELQNPITDPIMRFLSIAGDNGEIFIIIGVSLLIFRKHRKAGITVLLSLLFMLVINDLFLKEVIQRQRPYLFMEDIKLIVDEATSYSFPSGHAASAFAAVFTLLHFYKKPLVRGLAIGLGVVMAFNRLYLTIHYPTDVLAGIAVGFLCSFLAIKTYEWGERLIKSRFKKVEDTESTESN